MEATGSGRSLAKSIEEAELFPKYSYQELRNEAWKWTLQEFLAV